MHLNKKNMSYKSYKPEISAIITNELFKGFNKLVYNDENHTYKLDGIDLTSVTKLVSSYEESVFEAVKVSNISAKSHNDKNEIQNSQYALSNQYFLDRWKFKGEYTRALGSYVHLFAESFPYFLKADLKEEQMIVDFYNELSTNYIHICNELKVYNTEFKFAGTIDLFVYDVKNNEFIIYDWKTSDNLNKSKNGHYKKPFDFFKSTKINGYNIQLIHYKYAFEQKFKDTLCLIPIELLVDFDYDKSFVVRNDSNGKYYYKVRFKVGNLKVISINANNPTYQIIDLYNLDLKGVHNSTEKITIQKNKKPDGNRR